MCKSLAEGGARCKSHADARLSRATDALAGAKAAGDSRAERACRAACLAGLSDLHAAYAAVGKQMPAEESQRIRSSLPGEDPAMLDYARSVGERMGAEQGRIGDRVRAGKIGRKQAEAEAAAVGGLADRAAESAAGTRLDPAAVTRMHAAYAASAGQRARAARMAGDHERLAASLASRAGAQISAADASAAAGSLMARMDMLGARTVPPVREVEDLAAEVAAARAAADVESVPPRLEIAAGRAPDAAHAQRAARIDAARKDVERMFAERGIPVVLAYRAPSLTGPRGWTAAWSGASPDVDWAAAAPLAARA